MKEKKRPRIYSRCGDLGETAMLSGPRIGKDHCRMVALGVIDELSAQIGVARTEEIDPDVDSILRRLQIRLLIVGAEIAALHPDEAGLRTVEDKDVRDLERAIDFWNEKSPVATDFSICGDCRPAAQINLARAICRRAERRTVALLRFDPGFSPRVVAWFNRFGDLLYVLARYESSRSPSGDMTIKMSDALAEFNTELV